MLCQSLITAVDNAHARCYHKSAKRRKNRGLRETMKKALIAMSGGVDSSVAALLMKQNGYDCIGCMMKLYGGEDGEGDSKCCSADDAEDARAVAFRLGIPFYVFNYTREFRENIIDKFGDCYLRGLTPNPCIDCNRIMKFGALYRRALELGCDVIVTGHYVRTEKGEDGKTLLKKASDPSKDQSYVLYSLTQEVLSHAVFPLGGLTKTEVRETAEKNGFVNSKKPDSQDICFIPDGDVGKAVKKFTGAEPPEGDFVYSDGRILGRHGGICKYTIGQRKGLGIAFEHPLYVTGIDAVNNKVLLGKEELLYSESALLRDVNWISGETPSGSVRCTVKIRYRAPETEAEVFPDGNGGALVRFASPQRAVTPGQAAVFYDGDTVLGGGEICQTPQ